MGLKEQPAIAVEWFALRVTYGREQKLQRLLMEKGVESFIPMKKVANTIGGKTELVSVPAVNNLIFVHSTKEVIEDWIKIGRAHV